MICKSCQTADHSRCVEADKLYAWEHSAGWCDCQHSGVKQQWLVRLPIPLPSDNGKKKR